MVLSTPEQDFSTKAASPRQLRQAIPDPVLALPGHIVRGDARSQLHGRIAEYVIVAAFAATFAAFEWLRSFMDIPPQPIPMSFLAGGLALYATVRIFLIASKLRALKASMKGKRELDSRLQQLGARGYYAFESVVDSYGLSIGTVLVGPTGLFVLQVKTYSQPGTPGERIEQPTPETLLIAGRPALGDPVRQARNAARRLAMTLEGKHVTGYNPLALLVFPGWKIGRSLSKGDVRVINEAMLSDLVCNLPAVLETRDIITLCEALHTCRATLAE